MPAAVRLRRWQKQALDGFAATDERDYLAVATPGAGKTTFALTAAAGWLAANPGHRLIVVAPTAHLKAQWAAAAACLGIRLEPAWASGTGLAGDMHGIAVLPAGRSEPPSAAGTGEPGLRRARRAAPRRGRRARRAAHEDDQPAQLSLFAALSAVAADGPHPVASVFDGPAPDGGDVEDDDPELAVLITPPPLPGGGRGGDGRSRGAQKVELRERNAQLARELVRFAGLTTPRSTAGSTSSPASARSGWRRGAARAQARPGRALAQGAVSSSQSASTWRRSVEVCPIDTRIA